MMSYFDFFFERQPSCRSHWVFKDDTVREDFRDWYGGLRICGSVNHKLHVSPNRCRDTNCLPSMKAAQEGEDEDAKKLRKQREAETAVIEDLFDRSMSSMACCANDDDKDEAEIAAEDYEYDRCGFG
jgi:hypothetical protein